MYRELLAQRHLPELLTFADGTEVCAAAWPKRREEIRQILLHELFGTLPDVPYTLEFAVEKEENHYYMGGKALIRIIRITVQMHGESFFWNAVLSVPKSDHPVPVFVMAAFEKFFPVDTLPAEEILDAGYGICTFVCPKVTSDDGDFTNGLARAFYPEGKRELYDGGKIAVWAWAASRIVDVLVQMPEVDTKRLIVVGHSRLGKTALWAGAMDDRFAAVVAVQSGCGGAALARANTGEKVEDITRNFPFWFSQAYAAYAGREDNMPFDQHFLLSLIAPRLLCVTSAAGDLWADPLGEYLDCLAVSPVYDLLGKQGVEETEKLTDSVVLHAGNVGYNRRPGNHFFSRTDWNHILSFLDAKL